MLFIRPLYLLIPSTACYIVFLIKRTIHKNSSLSGIGEGVKPPTLDREPEIYLLFF